MFQILFIIKIFLIFSFSSYINKLESPSFIERKHSYKTLKKWEPISWIAIGDAYNNTEYVETNYSCSKLLAPIFSLEEGYETCDKLHKLINFEEELHELPFISSERIRASGLGILESTKYAQIYIAEKLRKKKIINSDFKFYYEKYGEAYFYYYDDGYAYKYNSYLADIDNIRFAVRGLKHKDSLYGNTMGQNRFLWKIYKYIYELTGTKPEKFLR